MSQETNAALFCQRLCLLFFVLWALAEINVHTGWPKKSKPLSQIIIKTRHYGLISHRFRLENENKNMSSLY